MMSKRLITQYILIALFSIHRAMGQSYFDAAANGTLTVEPSSSYEFLVSGLTWDQAYYSDDELNGNAGAIFSDTDVRDAFIEPTIAVTGEGTIDLVLIAYRFNEENYCEAGDTNTECDYTRGPVVVYATSIDYDAAGSPSSSQLYDINFTDYQESSVTADSRQMNRVFYTRPTDITNTSSQSNLAATIPTVPNEPMVEMRLLNYSHKEKFSDDEASLDGDLDDTTNENTSFIDNQNQPPTESSGFGGSSAPAPGNAPGCCSVSISNGLLRNTAIVVAAAGGLGSVVVAVYDYEDDECTNYSWDWLGRLLNSKGCDDDDGDGGGGGDGGEGDGPPPPAVSLLEPGDQDDLFLYIKVSNESTSNMTLSSIQIPGIQSASQERNITFLPELKN